ncbi:MAG: hypothetical protein AAGF44_04900 [Pseudomonadota bacterium]
MRAALALALLLTACTIPGRITAPQVPIPPPSGPEIVVRLNISGQPARQLVQEVALNCWLDGILGGEQMVVRKQTGRIVIGGASGVLVAADFLPSDAGSRLRLSGSSIPNRAQQDAMVAALDRGVRTGQTSCPRLAG